LTAPVLAIVLLLSFQLAIGYAMASVNDELIALSMGFSDDWHKKGAVGGQFDRCIMLKKSRKRLHEARNGQVIIYFFFLNLGQMKNSKNSSLISKLNNIEFYHFYISSSFSLHFIFLLSSFY